MYINRKLCNFFSRYIEMDLTKSLVYNLQGSSLIEHPVIVIAHQSHAAYFQQGNFFKFIILIQYIYIYT